MFLQEAFLQVKLKGKDKFDSRDSFVFSRMSVFLAK
jgi:hypothetical protein